MLDPFGERNVAEEHSLLEHQAGAGGRERAVLARVVALLDAQFGQEIVERLAARALPGGQQGGVERPFHGRPFGPQRSSRLRQLLP